MSKTVLSELEQITWLMCLAALRTKAFAIVAISADRQISGNQDKSKNKTESLKTSKKSKKCEMVLLKRV